MMYWLMYERLKQRAIGVSSGGELTAAGALGAGACAGTLAALATTPLDVVKTRLMTSPDVYRGVLQCVRKTIADEGALAMFKGVQPRVLWIGLGGGCFFSVLETARGVLLPVDSRRS